MKPEIERLYQAIDATWPAAHIHSKDGWTLRKGEGGGKRVSAATTDDLQASITTMEEAQASLGQPPLVMVRHGQEGLDTRLQHAGYPVIDPVRLYLAECQALAQSPPPVTAFVIDGAPTKSQAEIWATDGIGPGRLAVMDRCNDPKCTLLGRSNDTPVGTAFVACDGDIAMLHALVVLPAARRQNLATHMMWAASSWALDHGAKWLSVLVVKDNAPANALYASLNMEAVGEYHYRIHPSA